MGAYVLCRDDAGRVLLTRFRGPGHPDHGKWGMPGGGMEWGESAAEAATRELREETGLAVTLGGVAGVFSRWYTAEESARGQAGHLLGIVFESTAWSGALRTDFHPDDPDVATTDAARWFTLEEVRALHQVELVEFAIRLTADHDREA